MNLDKSRGMVFEKKFILKQRLITLLFSKNMGILNSLSSDCLALSTKFHFEWIEHIYHGMYLSRMGI